MRLDLVASRPCAVSAPPPPQSARPVVLCYQRFGQRAYKHAEYCAEREQAHAHISLAKKNNLCGTLRFKTEKIWHAIRAVIINSQQSYR